jgi:hypothetical protein
MCHHGLTCLGDRVSLLPGLASNCDLPISTSQVPGFVGVHYASLKNTFVVVVLDVSYLNFILFPRKLFLSSRTPCLLCPLNMLLQHSLQS